MIDVPENEQPTRGEAEERVPLFGTWQNAYRIVAATLALDIVLLYACTRWLS